MDNNQILKVIRILFYIFVTATVIFWLLAKYQGISDTYWLYSGVAAVGLSVLRFVMRFMA